MVVFGQKWLYAEKSSYIRQKRLHLGNVVVFGNQCFVRAVVVVFEQSGCFFGKSGCILAKVVVFGQSGCIRGKVVVFGQSGCIRAKVVLFGQMWL